MIKKKLIIGLGLTGKSCIQYFKEKSIPFKVFDTRSKNYFNKSTLSLIEKNMILFESIDEEYLSDIEEAVISPGLSKKHIVFKILDKLNISVVTDIDIFKRYSSVPIISVTGTNGKTTVVSMLEHTLNKCNIRSIACGNNGIPPLSIINIELDYVILELSSYQLEYMHDFNSYISLITNIEDDHSERHGSFNEYASIKKKIFQSSNHILMNICLKNISFFNNMNLAINIFGINKNLELLVCSKIVSDIKVIGQTIYLLNESIEYMGNHNLENILAVLSITQLLDIKILESFSAISSYKYPSHRIQLVKKINNISWYNDSKSTNSASTKAALRFIDKNIILILGGSKKIMSYESLSNIINAKVKLLIFLGENKEYIKKQLSIKTPIKDVRSMDEAVQVASEYASIGNNILLSPASPSFDMFDNYKTRGSAFVKSIEKYVK